MDIRLESTLRVISVVPSYILHSEVGRESPINDELWITVASILGVILGFRIP